MDEEISIINSNTRTEKIKNYLASNKKKILISILIIIIIIFAIFIFKEVEDRNKIKLSNQYYEATAAFENGDISKAKQILNLVIFKEDATYSPLALYFLIDKELIKSADIINENYDNIINNLNLEKEIKFLIIYKKALYNSDFVNESELIDILSPVINSKSIWKSHGLFLLGEYFLSKNEKQKAKEFYETILTLDNSNIKIKALAEKRIQNEFSEK